jgi:hypothetical protein
MTDTKREKRLLRILRLLSRRPALLRDTVNLAVRLLEFAGERSLRCERADIDAMHRSGWIEIERDGEAPRLHLSEDGQTFLRRRLVGDCAGQHRQLRGATVRIDGSDHAVTINDTESPLAALARLTRPDGKTWLDRAELAAGERLRGDFERAMLQPRVTASWDPAHLAGARNRARNARVDASDSALAARGRVSDAIAAVGPELGGALLDVCCFLKGLEQVERERGWPRRSAKLMLKTALAALDRHYHPQPARTRPARAILHWGADGYRPELRAD